MTTRKRRGAPFAAPARACFAALIPILLAASPAGSSGDPAIPRPIPVSCLYLHEAVMEADPSAGKRAGRAEVGAAGFAPALAERPVEEAPDSLATLVILLDWEDQQAFRNVHTPASYRKTFFQTTANGDETMADYYAEVSGGRFAPRGDVTVWLRSSRSYHYYVNGDLTPGTADDHGFDTNAEAFDAEPYPTNVWGIVREAVELADAAGVDFSLFDNDGPDGIPSSGDDDGIVDALVVIHAGTGAEGSFDPLLGADAIWSHKSDMSDPYLLSRIGATEADGVWIGPYNLDPEIGQIGVYAHEYGHILGLPDLYRTYSGSSGTVQESSVGYYCLMDAGSLLPANASGGEPRGSTPAHICPFFKVWLGWIEEDGYDRGGPAEVESIRLDAIARGGSLIRLLANPNGTEWKIPGAEGEYFLLENRSAVGFDRNLPGGGLLVWHVDERRSGNDPDDYRQRLVNVVEADGGYTGEIGTENLGEEEDFWPVGGGRDWTPETDPNTALYGGAYSGVSVTDIVKSGTVVTFDIEPPTIQSGEPIVYPNPFRPGETGTVTVAFRGGGSSPDPSTVRVRIFDILGSRVRVLDPSEGEIVIETDGTLYAEWDGRNDSGEEAASGLYLYVLHAGGETRTGKIAVIR
ncbi:MAG: M6 family metalloprotease domain-containing protein [Candidatus Eisenbacteria bacterium]|nr:M6 family metalloprotease domain-containing protein [Candidatus Eisenbacteria bacterium]